MILVLCLLTLLLGSCHGVSTFETSEEAASSVMPQWQRYQQCLTEGDATVLLRFIEDFERSETLTGPEPPAWMKPLGAHVAPQPLRTSVDPYELGAACTMRAAALLAGSDRLAEAGLLYQRILARYPAPAFAYYRRRAQAALASLPQSDPPIVAVRMSPHR